MLNCVRHHNLIFVLFAHYYFSMMNIPCPRLHLASLWWRWSTQTLTLFSTLMWHLWAVFFGPPAHQVSVIEIINSSCHITEWNISEWASERGGPNEKRRESAAFNKHIWWRKGLLPLWSSVGLKKRTGKFGVCVCVREHAMAGLKDENKKWKCFHLCHVVLTRIMFFLPWNTQRKLIYELLFY